MRIAIKAALAVLLGCGALLLVLGIVIWTGHGDQLIPVHITIGAVLVLTLWTIAYMAARARVPAVTVAFAAGWGLLVVVLGLAQDALLPGTWHWTIQVLHLVISMAAIWWGRRLVELMRRGSVGQPSVTHPSIATSGSRTR
jgi:hypothetical protein